MSRETAAWIWFFISLVIAWPFIVAVAITPPLIVSPLFCFFVIILPALFLFEVYRTYHTKPTARVYRKLNLPPPRNIPYPHGIKPHNTETQ